MPRGQLTKDIIKCEILKIKNELDKSDIRNISDPKHLAHVYLNKVLDKLDEYSY